MSWMRAKLFTRCSQKTGIFGHLRFGIKLERAYGGKPAVLYGPVLRASLIGVLLVKVLLL